MINKLLKLIRISFADSSWKRKIKYLTKNGCQIGEGTHLNCSVKSFGTEPYLISIGKNCTIAGHTMFITHDGAVETLNNLDYFKGVRMDNVAPIKVGNNVYIGTGAFIMPGVSIGDNSIIGAGAIVTSDIPSNCVAVGMPARVIETIEEYAKHIKDKQRLFPTATMSQKKKREYLIKGIYEKR